jgi:hypothetical protein
MGLSWIKDSDIARLEQEHVDEMVAEVKEAMGERD